MARDLIDSMERYSQLDSQQSPDAEVAKFHCLQKLKSLTRGIVKPEPKSRPTKYKTRDMQYQRAKDQPLKPEPDETNRPQPHSRCPKCGDRSEAFAWHSKETTWRCRRCRRPVQFDATGTVSLNFLRDGNERTGWRLPNSEARVQLAATKLAELLMSGPQPVKNVRDAMRKAKFKKREVDRAIIALKVSQRQIERPGPVYCLTQEQRRKVAKFANRVIVNQIDRTLEQLENDKKAAHVETE